MQETQETWARSLGQEDLLEKEMAIHSSILAWVIPWTEEPGRLQSMRSQLDTTGQLSMRARARTHTHTHTHTHTTRAHTHTHTHTPQLKQERNVLKDGGGKFKGEVLSHFCIWELP